MNLTILNCCFFGKFEIPEAFNKTLKRNFLRQVDIRIPNKER